jgi:PAB-dependent poly(A)-specific ribonuclease subunit 2
MDKETTTEEWVLVNGFVVSNTVIEDAKALHVKFKEPSLVVFRALDEQEDESGGSSIRKPMLTLDVMRTQSMTNGLKSPCASPQRLKHLPGKGDLIAFDAEFVSVQEEESVLTDTGTKVTIRETRHALARISVIDCRTRDVVLDDHVLPHEPVVDYLTRFSGIVAKDLIPKQSPHHLIGTRAAYLKLRFLMERGCIFIGHGLQQDFWTVNLAVPANQIIDTVAIYHKPSQRMVSLRFLSNFVLKRDMQQDVHDSVEDAIAAYDLYAKAVELKKKGEFEKLLDDLYDFGQKTDWKLGLDE